LVTYAGTESGSKGEVAPAAMPASVVPASVVEPPLEDPEDDAPDDAPPGPDDEPPPAAPRSPTFPVHAATSAYTRAPPRSHEALGIAGEGRLRGSRILNASWR
jgi:hypothetical protein